MAAQSWREHWAFTSVRSGLKTETQSKPLGVQTFGNPKLLGAQNSWEPQEHHLPYTLHRFLEYAPPQTLVGMCPDGLLH